MPRLDADRLLPADPHTRRVARRLYDSIASLPILSPHGHTQAQWFAEDEAFPNPSELFIVPDHYIFRMLYSQRKIRMEQLGIGGSAGADPRELWRIFAENYYLFRGTPTRLWLDYAFEELFQIEERLNAENADLFYDRISEKLNSNEFRPRALYERFNIEALSTTDSPLDTLEAHRQIRASGWRGRILPTFRPDSVVDPDFANFAQNVRRLGEMHTEDSLGWSGYLRALRKARTRFKELGCTATDHGHPTVNTANLDQSAAGSLFEKVLAGGNEADRELFRAQMLTELARMSVEDGLVMQIHPGSFRNHNRTLFEKFGRDVGADIPTPTDYVYALKPLLDELGNDPRLTIVLFTLDESAYSRELAPLAGHYPCLLLGPPWWFQDSPEGMMRFREYATETAGFYNTVGFNDDTRAFLSIPGRHDVARRVDASYLARLVVEHRIEEDEAFQVACDLTNGLVRRAYKL